MALSKIIRRVFHVSEDSVDSGCQYDINHGLQSVINSGALGFMSIIGMSLEEEVVKVRVSNEVYSSRDSSSSSSSDGGSQSSNHDCGDGVTVRKGVKVSEVHSETFCHGFGLRCDDIIISVNNMQAKSATMVASIIHRIVKCRKHGKLRMEIHRKESGLIILDNGGDDVSDLDDNDLVLINCTTSQIKSFKFNKYLMVTSSGKIALSKFKTKLEDRTFIVRHYAKSVTGETAEEKLITLEHKKSGHCIWIENSEITLKPRPDGHSLPINSNYIFKLLKSDKQNFEYYQPNNEPGNEMGFTSRRAAASLLSQGNDGGLFQIFPA